MTAKPDMHVDITFTPAGFEMLPQRDLSGSACVVFDILRATSTIVTALARGAESVQPVASIAEALKLRQADPNILLAGERNGLRITADVSGGPDFDLGNSPREYTADRVRGRRIVSTTTNGTRAFAACRGARHVFAASFLNLKRTAGQLLRTRSSDVVLVCSGTGEDVAFEDCLGAGALLHELLHADPKLDLGDSARIVADLFAVNADDLESAMQKSSNARRLLSMPELAEDVSFCLTENLYPIVVAADPQGKLYRADINQ
jgi:2-phosphosulfolactate phosphatase